MSGGRLLLPRSTVQSITPVVFSHPVTRRPIQKIMERIFYVSGVPIHQRSSCDKQFPPHHGKILVSGYIESQSSPPDFAIFRAHASVASVRFLSRAYSRNVLKQLSGARRDRVLTAGLTVEPFSCRWTQRIPDESPFSSESTGRQTEVPHDR